ncbi:MAG: M48 family metalloprotease [Pseudomonadota bacterium]
MSEAAASLRTHPGRDGSAGSPLHAPASRLSSAERVLPASRLLRSGVLVGLFGALAGCSTLATQLPPAAQPPVVVTPAAEDVRDATIGAREHPRLVAAFGGVYQAPQMQRLLERVIDRLVPASDRPDLRYEVTILDAQSVNAFALPGGYIYVTRGLLALANSEAEVASVLAHEMAHVTARHAAEREARVRAASQTDAPAGVGAQQLEITLANFSQAQEVEADRIGINTMARAGYDPTAAARFLVSMGRKATLEASANRPGRPDFLASHPSTPARIEAARKVADNLPPGRIGETQARYLKTLDGIRYGSPVGRGSVSGRAYRDPVTGVRFTAPPGFTLDASGKGTVFGIGPDDDALRFDTVDAEGAGTPVAVITSGWIEGAEVREVRPLIVGGLPAATALASVGEWTFRLGAVRFGDRIYRFVMGARALTSAKDQGFLTAIRSFERGSLRGAIKPTRIRTLTVRDGDTVPLIARRMEVEGDAVRLFLVLNGLTPGEALRTGQTVKIVRS